MALWARTIGSQTGLEPNTVPQAQPQPHQSPPVTLMLKPQPFSQILVILDSSFHSDI